MFASVLESHSSTQHSTTALSLFYWNAVTTRVLALRRIFVTCDGHDALLHWQVNKAYNSAERRNGEVNGTPAPFLSVAWKKL
jgi:hypothetical protein